MNKYNIALCIEPFPEEEITTKIENNNIPFYYNVYINSWERLNFYVEKGVESVYVYGDLAFDLERVSKFCK